MAEWGLFVRPGMPLEPAKPVAKDGKPLSLNRTDALLAAILSQLSGGASGGFDMGRNDLSGAGSDFTLTSFGPAVFNRLLVANNARRVGLIFAVGTGGYRIWPTSAVSGTFGIPVPNTGFLELLRYRHGSVVAGEWWANAAAMSTANVIEVFG